MGCEFHNGFSSESEPLVAYLDGSHNALSSMNDHLSWGRMMNREEVVWPSGSGTRVGEVQSTLLLSMLPGLGPRTLSSLLERFGSPGTVLRASELELAAVRGVGPKLIHTIQNANHYVDVESIVCWCRENKTHLLSRGAPDYPCLLNELNDAPPILFAQGTVEPKDQLAVAMVGTRHATNYGLKQAHRFAFALAQAGVTVVSGLARNRCLCAPRGSRSRRANHRRPRQRHGRALSAGTP